ncbi:MAG: SDR family oxidoreductase [Thermodesulfobacteriota bacterium]|nr:SDR family oxidoreductase [Thermodesulfobacteriota bacterium]
MLLKDKTAVVTGCNRGMGKAIVGLLAENGANVWACLRKADKAFDKYLSDLKEQFDVTISPVYFDLAHGDEVKEGAKQILSAKVPVDVLVNNAGIVYTALFQMTSIDKLKEVFDINFFSHILFSQYMAKSMMRQRGGSIINISSSAGIDGNEGRLAYASSKASIICATKVMAKDLASYHIRVNAIAPGLVNTDMMAQNTPEDVLSSTVEQSCMKRVGEPEEIARAVLFLASHLSSYMTGQILRVDGGMYHA